MDRKMQPFKKGMIILWSGAIVDIPGGWALCDGTNGTPNLENSFIVGAGDTYVVAATGGAINHNHALPANGHTHDIDTGAEIAAGDGYAALASLGYVEGVTVAADGRPPYYALAYIMKL